MRTFIELLKERLGWPACRLQQRAENMVVLFPKVHSLLVLLRAAQCKLVDQANVGDMAVLLKLCTNALPEVLRRDVQRV